MNFIHPSLKDEETNKQLIIKLPFKRVLCPCCGGYGVSDRGDIDTSALVDGMMEDGDDEGLESYYNGGFDEPCNYCNGNNVVDEPDYDHLRNSFPIEYAKIIDWEEAESKYNKYRKQEMACGA